MRPECSCALRLEDGDSGRWWGPLSGVVLGGGPGAGELCGVVEMKCCLSELPTQGGAACLLWSPGDRPPVPRCGPVRGTFGSGHGHCLCFVGSAVLLVGKEEWDNSLRLDTVLSSRS